MKLKRNYIMSISFAKIQTGEFNVLKDVLPSGYTILNGSLGQSGQGPNLYGIVNHTTGKITWIGSLAKCKRMIQHWLK